MQNSKTSKDDAWQVIDKTPISYSKDINGLYLHKRILNCLERQTTIGLNPSIAVLSLLKAFNVTYSQTSDKRPGFLVIAGKDFETETLEGKIYTQRRRPQLR